MSDKSIEDTVMSFEDRLTPANFRGLAEQIVRNLKPRDQASMLNYARHLSTEYETHIYKPFLQEVMKIVEGYCEPPTNTKKP